MLPNDEIKVKVDSLQLNFPKLSFNFAEVSRRIEELGAKWPTHTKDQIRIIVELPNNLTVYGHPVVWAIEPPDFEKSQSEVDKALKLLEVSLADIRKQFQIQMEEERNKIVKFLLSKRTVLEIGCGTLVLNNVLYKIRTGEYTKYL